MRLQKIHFASSMLLAAMAPHAQAGSTEPIWSSGPVRVDRADQSMERLPAKPTQEMSEPDPDKYPLKLKRTLPFRVIDSVSFVHDGRKYRLIDLDPVPVAKICRRESGQRWACGLKSRIALTALLRGKQILCAQSGERNGFTMVECTRSSKDLGSLMVEAGQALAVGPHYQAEQDIARREKAGVWGDTVSAAY
jgi:endonuclease YncB( thermonuclease family)